jgi:hypothetical protein
MLLSACTLNVVQFLSNNVHFTVPIFVVEI